MTPEEQLSKLLWGIAIDLQEAIKERMIKLGINFTGAAVSSVKAVVKKDKIIISMNDYLEYIEYGMPNPTSPEELRDWVEKKLMKDYDGKDRTKAIEQTSIRLADHITRFGPRPNPFIRPVLQTELPKIVRQNIEEFSS